MTGHLDDGAQPRHDGRPGPTPAEADGSYWGRLATYVTTHPGRTLALALVLVLPPLLALPSLRLSHDTLDELPPGTSSVEGFDVLAEHFAPGEVSPLILVIDGDSSVYEPASFRALGDLSRNLKRMPQVATVRSVAMPTDGEVPDLGDRDDVGALEQLPQELTRAASGAARIADGAAAIRDGLAEIDRRLPELADGVDAARDGADELLDGVQRLRDGMVALRAGLGELRDGLVRARDASGQLRDDVAVPTDAALREAWDALRSFTVGLGDPEYERATRNVGEAYGRVTGEDPVTGQPVAEGYEGLAAALDDLATGLGSAVDGVDDLDAGAGQLTDGLDAVADGLRQLRDGFAEAGPGIEELQDGIEQLLAGARLLAPGAQELADGLEAGAVAIDQAGLTDVLLGTDAGPFVLTPGIVAALPDIRDDLAFFVTEDETRTRLFIGLADTPFDQAAIDAVDEIERTAQRTLLGSPLEDARVVPTGVSAFFNDLDAASARDFRLIIVAVIVGVFLVLVLLLRAVVAPLYMVATVLLSFGSALGIAVIAFQGVLGQQGLAWWIPPFLYVLLVALGADYNIFLMSRVREEAETRTTRNAVAEGMRLTGGVITSAGLILAGTFAALMAAPMSSLQQMGFATTVGILLDTFVVRTFLVPALAVLVGRHNWWPSSRARAIE